MYFLAVGKRPFQNLVGTSGTMFPAKCSLGSLGVQAFLMQLREDRTIPSEENLLEDTTKIRVLPIRIYENDGLGE